MSNTTMKTARLVQMAILIALLAVMTYTPIGFILVPPVSITLMHIPVIVGSIVMGPLYGGILGLAFGVLSMIKATTAAVAVTDMAFSPFLSGSPVASIILCLAPRILLGVIAGGLYQLLSKHLKKDTVSTGISAVVATACHTVMVLGCLALLFDALPLKQVLVTVASLNGLLEMAAAAVVCIAICKPLRKTSNR